MRSRDFVAVLSALALVGCQALSDSGKSGSKPARSGGGLLSALRPAPVIVPEDTLLPVVLETGISSHGSHEGDLVVGKLESDVRVGEKVVLAAGTEIKGKVTAAVPSGKVKGRARLAFDFDTVVFKGKDHSIEARAVDITAPNTHKRDAEIIGGGTAGGALIGALVGGKKGAGIGALVGAGAGTGVVLTNTGDEVNVPSGSRISVKLTREARL